MIWFDLIDCLFVCLIVWLIGFNGNEDMYPMPSPKQNQLYIIQAQHEAMIYSRISRDMFQQYNNSKEIGLFCRKEMRYFPKTTIVGDGLEAGFVLLTAGALPPKSPNFKRASRWLVSNTPPVGRFGQSRFFKIPPMKIKGHCVPWAPSKQTYHICLLQCIFQRGSTKPWEN